MPHPLDDPEIRRERIKILHGVDIDDPFEHLVFPDGTAQWKPITIVMGWLALMVAECHGDIERGEAYRVATLRVGRLTPEDWDKIEMVVRSCGIKLADAVVTEE